MSAQPSVPRTPGKGAFALKRQCLDWIEVVKPERGDILVMRVPNEKFIHPGTPVADVTPEQQATMEAAHQVLGTLIGEVQQAGVQLGGAAILAEEMKLEDLPPPWEKHPDARSPIALPDSRIVLPPGTKI